MRLLLLSLKLAVVRLRSRFPIQDLPNKSLCLSSNAKSATVAKVYSSLTVGVLVPVTRYRFTIIGLSVLVNVHRWRTPQFVLFYLVTDKNNNDITYLHVFLETHKRRYISDATSNYRNETVAPSAKCMFYFSYNNQYRDLCIFWDRLHPKCCLEN